MPIIKFDVQSATGDKDRTVFECEEISEAQREALKLAGTAISDAGGTFWQNPEWMLIATDETDVTVFQLQVLGAEGPAARNLSRTGFGEGTFDHKKQSNYADTGVDGC
jgi:hypothetical protein